MAQKSWNMVLVEKIISAEKLPVYMSPQEDFQPCLFEPILDYPQNAEGKGSHTK